jgi:hypothetical protein
LKHGQKKKMELKKKKKRKQPREDGLKLGRRKKN